MPLTRSIADAIGVLIISLVSISILAGFTCIIYSFYFRSRIRNQGLNRLNYFTGPWIIRVLFVIFTIWWGIGEIIRVNFLRRDGRVLNALNSKWQETVCKGYIVSNLGFAEPCLLLTLMFLLRAPLQRIESGPISQKWNRKTAGYVFLYCLPISILQLVITLIEPILNKDMNHGRKLPQYFTSFIDKTKNPENISMCTYPLLSTILLGLFVTSLVIYLFFIGGRILKLVINKGLKKRIYTLVFSISGFFTLRVLLLGLSVLSKPDHLLFEGLSFLSFLSLLCCVWICTCVLVYFPIADSLALGKTLHDLESQRNDTISLIAYESLVEENTHISSGRYSNGSTNRGSISFRTMERGGTPIEPFVELSLFSPSRHGTPPGSPSLLGWPMRPYNVQVDDEP